MSQQSITLQILFNLKPIKIMKKTIEMMKAALMLLVVMMMGMTITSCSDDDDKSSDWPSKFTQSITANGQSITIDEVLYEEDSYLGVDYYVFTAHNESRSFTICIPKVHMGKKLDLTKDLRPSQNSPMTVIINHTYAYGDGAFESGSYLIATFDGTNLKIYAKGKALKYGNYLSPEILTLAPSKDKYVFQPYTFEISFSGKVEKYGILR